MGLKYYSAFLLFSSILFIPLKGKGQNQQVTPALKTTDIENKISVTDTVGVHYKMGNNLMGEGAVPINNSSPASSSAIESKAMDPTKAKVK